ncbi:hypothetical protein CTheo_7938 [Ceratobasidium theobromae]|uniref:Alcohol oxidase n=1 Tax=Ceratobasidium theobromae TaxID=1582974 RepID=A0A5N5QAC9_9AGAM|nr:hypothetical protein CTheo_7938 [Ceratobasidium theobromae]
MVEHPLEVDIIFAGGGTAACVTAGRLATANPDLRILLVEQGPNNLNNQTVLTPALFMSHLEPGTKNALFWKGNKAKPIHDREPLVATGGILGGGSRLSLLYLIPTSPHSHLPIGTPERQPRRCNPTSKLVFALILFSDFDDWDTPGWKSKDLIPLLQKTETYHIAPRRDTHGYSGPIHVSYANYYSQVAKEYLDVCARKGVPQVEDIMDLRTGHGCSRLAKFIHPLTGHRQDAAHRYIHSQPQIRHLHVLTKTLVTRVLFDGTKAIGVEVIGNKNQDPDADQTPRRIIAHKLVVVSAGTFGSAMILQRSGIGEAAWLSHLGVDTVVDLPGVGLNYQDHAGCLVPYHVADDTETIDIIAERRPEVMKPYLDQFANGKGFLTSNVNDAGSKLRPTPEELKEMGPEFNEVWKRMYESAPDKPVILQTIANGFLRPSSLVTDGSRFMMAINIATYPLSRGYVRASADPYTPPDFQTGFLEDQADVEVLKWIYKKSRSETLRRMPSYRGEFAPLHPRFPGGSAAACVRLDGPPPTAVEDLIYSPEDNTAVEEFVRQTANTIWHPIGTVQMQPRDKGGCIDSRLNVYGTTHLKVADLSILPRNVGANTCSTALLIGEKAAMLIAEDLGLTPP